MQKIEEKTEELQTAINAFYEALQAIFQGDTSPMEEIWSHADDVTYLGPQGGIIIGWQEVLNAWSTQARINLKGKIEPQDIHILREGNIGISHNYEVGNNDVNGTLQTVRIRAVNIFRKENGKWKMIMHQTDLLPFLENKSL